MQHILSHEPCSTQPAMSRAAHLRLARLSLLILSAYLLLPDRMCLRKGLSQRLAGGPDS